MANSHKRDTARKKPFSRPRAAFVAAPLAVLATGVAVTWGVLGGSAGHLDLTATGATGASGGAADLAAAAHRPQTVSRSEQRPAVTPTVTPALHPELHRMWTTDALNLWTAPQGGRKTGEVKARVRIRTAHIVRDGRVEIVVDGKDRWVTTGYLSKTKPPADPATMGLNFAPCGDMGVTNGLVPDMIRAYEAVCNAFPGEVSTYGGLGPREEHNTGHAVDAMVYGDSALGQRIADFLQAHAAELNLYDIIWQQHIWTPVRSAEGWRMMPDRGSPTANHMDHVHFGVN